MSSQIVFLFDLDQCLPLEQCLDNDNLEFLISKVKEVCLKILCASSHLNGPNNETRNLAKFSFRFYSSTEYFMVPDQHEATFQELNEDQFNILETALSDRFEILLQTSKTNSFNSNALQQHILSTSTHKSQCSTLKKALEEVAILYNWDQPMMQSPVKLNGKTNALNAIYVFTRLPNNNEDLLHFMGKPKVKKFNHKEISERLFSRSMTNIFKGDAAQVNVNIVDTSNFRHQMPVTNPEEYRIVKNDFRKCLFQLHGTVIPIDAFRSKNCAKNFENPHPTSSVLTMYSSAGPYEKPKSRQLSLEIGGEDSKILKLNASEDLNLAQVGTSHDLKLQTFIRPNSNLISNLHYEKKVLLWPNGDSKSSSDRLANFMISQKYNAIFKCGSIGQSGVLIALEESLFLLKLFSPKQSKLVDLLTVPSEFHESLLETFSVDFKSLFEEKMPTPKTKFEVPTSNMSFFRGSLIGSSALPETRPFNNIINRVKNLKNKDSEMLLKLKKSYLPQHISEEKSLKMRRKTSEESVSSNQSSKGRSRGAELLRLGSKNAELRRNSHEGDGKETVAITTVKTSQPTAARSNVESKENLCDKFLADIENVAIGPSGDTSGQKLLKKLADQQLEMLDHGTDNEQAAFAKAAITILLRHVKSNNNKQSLEEIMYKNFLIEPAVVENRKSNTAVRVRNYKEQILFRLEVHRVMTSQDGKKKIEEEMLAHLRKISIKEDSPKIMLSLLQDILTTDETIECQSDLLHFLYTEQDIPLPAALSDRLFSPSKKSEASLSPDKISSIPSELTSEIASNPSSWRIKLQDEAKIERMRKAMHRPQNSMQIDLRDKKCKQEPKKAVKPKAVKTPKRSRAVSSSGKTPVKRQSHGVRRNLSFVDGFGLQNSSPAKKKIKTSKCTPKKGSRTPMKGGRTPKKGSRTPMKGGRTPMKGGRTPKKGSKTPKKTPNKQQTSYKTPCKMTPGKQHIELVPETPAGKSTRRKSDGTLMVKESPNIDKLKKDINYKPLSASFLTKSTSFYSGDTSRNVVAAEEKMNIKHLQNLNVSLPLRLNDNGEMNTSKMLFPFMESRKRQQSTSSISTTPLKEEQKNDQQMEARRSKRNLFEDVKDTEITLKSPFKVQSRKRQQSISFTSATPLKNDMIDDQQSEAIRTKRNLFEDEKDTESSLKSPYKVQSRKRQRSTSSTSSTPLKKDVVEDQQPEARRSKRNLFEDAKDIEITLKSPFKVQSRKRQQSASTTSTTPLKKNIVDDEQPEARRSKRNLFEDGKDTEIAMKSPFKVQSRKRQQSASTTATTPLKKDPIDDQQPEIRRSTRRLFEEAKDNQTTLRSPFKIPPKAAARTLFSPIKTDNEVIMPRIRRRSSTSNKSPTKSNVQVKTLKKEETPTNNYSPPAKNAKGVITPRIRKFASSNSPVKRVKTPKKCANNSPVKENIRVQTPKKCESVANNSESLFTPERSNDRFDQLFTKDKDVDERLLLTPTTKTYSKASHETPQSKRVADEDIKTPDSASRPHRRKKPVEKFGIADVKLSQIGLSPGLSPRLSKTPRSNIVELELGEQNQDLPTMLDDIARVNIEKLDIDGIEVLIESNLEQPELRKSTRLSKTEEEPSKLSPDLTPRVYVEKLTVDEAKSPETKSLPQPELRTPESHSRPHRRRSFVEKMGIDDVKLSQLGSPKVCISPFSNHNRHIRSPNVATYKNVMEAHRTQLAGLISKDKEDTKVGVKTRTKPSAREATNQSDVEQKVSISHPKHVPVMTDLPKKVVTDQRTKKRKLVETIEKHESTSTESDESPEKKPTTPVKFNYESTVVGDFKLKINRTPVLKPFQPVQRISRRASMQLGLTPENLRELITRSPSPKKKIPPASTNISKSNKENFTSATKFSPLSSTSLADLTTSPILNLPLQKRRRPSKDSPNMPKRRRVSKKLYD